MTAKTQHQNGDSSTENQRETNFFSTRNKSFAGFPNNTSIIKQEFDI